MMDLSVNTFELYIFVVKVIYGIEILKYCHSSHLYFFWDYNINVFYDNYYNSEIITFTQLFITIEY